MFGNQENHRHHHGFSPHVPLHRTVFSVLDVTRATSCENENTMQWLLSNGAQSALNYVEEEKKELTLSKNINDRRHHQEYY